MLVSRISSYSPTHLVVASIVLALAVTLGPASSQPAKPARPSQMIDVFGGRLGKSALARDINGAGQLAGSFLAKDGFHAFTTVGRKVIDLGPGDAYAINDRGQVVGVARSENGFRAFLYDETGMHLLDEPIGGTDSIAYDINEEGQVVGQWQGPDVRGYRPFLWDESGGMRDLGTLGGDYARALAINDLGQVVGESWTTTDLDHPFLYDETGMHDLQPMIGAAAGNEWTIAGLQDINNFGQVIGRMHPSSGGSGQAFRFDLTSREFIALEPLDADAFVFPSDINDTGEIVGWATPPTRLGDHAVLWDGGPVQDLGTLGGSSSFAYAINEAGVVTGGAETRSGAEHIFTLSTR